MRSPRFFLFLGLSLFSWPGFSEPPRFADPFLSEARIRYFHNSDAAGNSFSVNGVETRLSGAVFRFRGIEAPGQMTGPWLELVFDTNLDPKTDDRFEIESFKASLLRLFMGKDPDDKHRGGYGEVKVLQYEFRKLGVYTGKARPSLQSIAAVEAQLAGTLNDSEHLRVHVMIRVKFLEFDNLNHLYDDNEEKIKTECPTCVNKGTVFFPMLTGALDGELGLGLELYQVVLLQAYAGGYFRQAWDLNFYEKEPEDALKRRNQMWRTKFEYGLNVSFDLSQALRLHRKYGRLSAVASYHVTNTEVGYAGGLKKALSHDKDNVIHTERFVDENAHTFSVSLNWAL